MYLELEENKSKWLKLIGDFQILGITNLLAYIFFFSFLNYLFSNDQKMRCLNILGFY
jgi:hypothetical protein